jgi:putative transposase
MTQVGFKFRAWGGKRKRAGRPKGVGLRHQRREVLKPRFPVHVTWRMERGVWNLRAQRCFSKLKAAFYRASKAGFKVVHYSVQGNHVHLLVEAQDARSLSRGMCGLGVRVARGLNRVMKRSGKVLATRYHAHILRTPSEARRARTYLLQNARKHYGILVADPYTSSTPVIEPETFLMRKLC